MRKGFTLIELLVVIAIVAVLAAILFPVFAKAREKARQTTCINNQHAIATALLMYAQDHNEQLPAAGEVWGDISLDKGVLKCPTAARLDNGYGFNANLSGLSLGEITEPSSTAFSADAATVDNLLYSWADADYRHNAHAIFSGVDGHVELTDLVPVIPVPTTGMLDGLTGSLTSGTAVGNVTWSRDGHDGWSTDVNPDTDTANHWVQMATDNGHTGLYVYANGDGTEQRAYAGFGATTVTKAWAVGGNLRFDMDAPATGGGAKLYLLDGTGKTLAYLYRETHTGDPNTSYLRFGNGPGTLGDAAGSFIDLTPTTADSWVPFQLSVANGQVRLDLAGSGYTLPVGTGSDWKSPGSLYIYAGNYNKGSVYLESLKYVSL